MVRPRSLALVASESRRHCYCSHLAIDAVQQGSSSLAPTQKEAVYRLVPQGSRSHSGVAKPTVGEAERVLSTMNLEKMEARPFLPISRARMS
jgi:hypothetical protein